MESVLCEINNYFTAWIETLVEFKEEIFDRFTADNVDCIFVFLKWVVGTDFTFGRAGC